jgi:hypothetical protein
MKFPKELDLKVDWGKVRMDVIKEWVAKRVTDLLGLEEEVLIGMIHNLLDEVSLPLAAILPQQFACNSCLGHERKTCINCNPVVGLAHQLPACCRTARVQCHPHQNTLLKQPASK